MIVQSSFKPKAYYDKLIIVGFTNIRKECKQMKKHKIFKSKITYAYILLTMLLFTIGCGEKEEVVDSESVYYEITDYLKNASEVNLTEQQYSALFDNTEQITVCFEDEKLTEIMLNGADDEASDTWTLCGLHPGMMIEDVQELLSVDGIVMERHNMQWYATGLELEKRGIQRLSWDPNDQITYVSALVDTEKIDRLQDYNLILEEQEYTYCDEKRNIDIAISYPLIELKAHKNIAENVNESIESIVTNMVGNYDLSNVTNVTINVTYAIRNAESEAFSIEWTGECLEEGSVSEIRTFLTCNLQEDGNLLELTDFGYTKGQLVSEIAWRVEDVNEAAVYAQLEDNYFDYYVTPLYIVIFTENPETKEKLATSIWRDYENEGVQEELLSVISADQYYTVYATENNTYLYEIYNSEGSIVWQEVLYRVPTISLYDSRYIEVEWGVGTGVWMNVYYDLETGFLTETLESARYIGDGVVAIMRDKEKRELYLFNPFEPDDGYCQSIQLDFDTKMANPTDCIIEISVNDDGEIQIEYWNEVGEKNRASVMLKLR